MRVVTRNMVVGGIALGVLAALATGGLPNEAGVGLPETQRFGHPWHWRVTDLNGPTTYLGTHLAVDVAFWALVAVAAFAVLQRAARALAITVPYRALVWALVVSVPMGLIMCLVHEVGHGLWGTVAGGRLRSIQVAYLVIDPVGIRLTPHFRLGAATVEGLAAGSFGSGLMLLGGAMTTSIAAWIVAVALRSARLSRSARGALKVFGLWGLLDLPCYVVFPQMGLAHWLVLGGCQPEPLIGTRMMGIPDPAVYVAVLLSTTGLVVAYFRSLRENAVNATKTTLATLAASRGAWLTRRAVLASVTCGVLGSLATGAVENQPAASIIGSTYYGHPLVWRVVRSTLTRTTDYHVPNLVLDALIWTLVSLAAYTVSVAFRRRTAKSVPTSDAFLPRQWRPQSVPRGSVVGSSVADRPSAPRPVRGSTSHQQERRILEARTRDSREGGPLLKEVYGKVGTTTFRSAGKSSFVTVNDRPSSRSTASSLLARKSSTL